MKKKRRSTAIREQRKDVSNRKRLSLNDKTEKSSNRNHGSK